VRALCSLCTYSSVDAELEGTEAMVRDLVWCVVACECTLSDSFPLYLQVSAAQSQG
jgi:hypothetical protein